MSAPDGAPALPRGLATAIIGGGDASDWEWDADYVKATLTEFDANYEVVGNEFLGNPKEDWYQGVDFTAVIRRKSDGKLFGYGWWTPVSKHGEPYFEPNGEEFGLGPDEFVFLPIRPFIVTGYEITKDGEL